MFGLAVDSLQSGESERRGARLADCVPHTFPFYFCFGVDSSLSLSVGRLGGMDCINARFDAVKGKNAPKGVFELASLDRGKVLAFTVHHDPQGNDKAKGIINPSRMWVILVFCCFVLKK